MKKGKAVVSWSGGKDCCLACYQAMKDGLEVSHILNVASAGLRRASAHGVKIELIALQARALGVALVQNLVTRDNYEAEFKRAIGELKREGISEMVTGDIHLEDSKTWMDRICWETGLNPVMPLWGRTSAAVLEEFIADGFEAIIVSTKSEHLGKDWLGRKLDRDFVRDLAEMKPEVDLCGEKGEFHTFAINGPSFKNRVAFSFGEKKLRNGYWLLDLEAAT